MKKKGIFTIENTESTEVDSVASVRSVVNTEDLPDGFQMTELGPLPKEWRVVRLGEVVKLTKGRKPDELIPKYQFGALPYLTADYFRNRLPTEWVPAQYLSKLPFCSKEDVVLIWDGSKAGQVFIGLEGVLASTMVRIDPENEIERDYLYFFLLTQFDLLNSKTTGTTIPDVNKEVFRNLPIPLPPLPEQRAIAHVLRTVQRAKEATEGVIAALRELKKSLMQHLFTYGPVPVTERERMALQENELGPLPAHWRVVRLGEVAKVRGGTAFPHEHQGKQGGKYPFYKVSDMNLSGNEIYMRKANNWIDEQTVKILRAKLFVKYTVIFPKIGAAIHTNKKRILISDALVDNNVMGVTICEHDQCYPGYLFYWFESIDIGQFSSPGPLPSITAQAVKNAMLPLPPLDEQREIARALQAVDARIAAEQARRAALEGLFKTLLQQLMTGQIRITDASGGDSQTNRRGGSRTAPPTMDTAPKTTEAAPSPEPKD